MEYVDLRRRREDRARSRRASEGSWQDRLRSPYIFLGAGFVLGAAAPGAFRYMFYPVDAFFLSLAILAVTVAVVCYAGWLLSRKDSSKAKPKVGAEKQLLMAIQDTGATTPIEAALETSLTVDEAEEILTRFSERGYLRIESQDGTLFYTLPGRCTAPDTRTV